MSLSRSIVARLNRNPLIDQLVYKTKHGPARGLKRQGGMGWLPTFVPRSHEWDAEETFLANLDWHELTIYDIGGDQGLFTLFFAHRAGENGQIITFEPNPQSFRRIQRNVSLNQFTNVRVLNIGIGSQRETLTFTFPANEPARGTATHSIANQIVSEASAIVGEIEVNSLDDEIARSRLPAPNFIKLDIEGMEYPALLGMQATLLQFRPRLFIEIHGADLQEKTLNIQQVVGLLEKLNYQMLHIESGSRVNQLNAEYAREGHLYCVPNEIA
ncbi:MAG: FkbM family methyltransferase [Acidobacteriota bacterium]